MRVRFCGRHPLQFRWARFISTADASFVELYGRNLNTTPSSYSFAPLEQKSSLEVTLDKYDVSSYINPNKGNSAVAHQTLKELRRQTESPFLRRTAALGSVWMTALTITSSRERLEYGVECLFILFYSHRYDECIELCEHFVSLFFQTALHAQNTNSLLLRALSVYVLSKVHKGEAGSEQVVSKAVELLKKTKQMVATVPKEERHSLVSCMQLLLWSFDWQMVFGVPPGERTLQELRQIIPDWLTDLFQPSAPCVPLDVDATKLMAPSHVKRLAISLQRMNGGISDLHRMYEWVVKHEERSTDFKLFSLSILLGNMLLGQRELSEKKAQRIISYLGTSADVSLLLQCGVANRNVRESVGSIFGQMKGSEAYEALKEMWWKTPEKFRVLQERRGDVLTGVASANWREALEKVEYAQSVGDGSWRKQLPETIRLLSDAGKHDQSLRLMWEYDSVSGSDNLSVAASLSQTARHTGKWWLALDVLNLMAGARTPQTSVDVAFLDEARNNAILTLKQANRWREALLFYTSLEGNVPERAFRTLCSLVSCMPTEAPWVEALALLQQDSRPIPEDVMSTILLLHGDRHTAPLKPSKYIWEGLSRNGDVRRLLAVKPEHPVKYYFTCLLNALSFSKCVDDTRALTYLTEIPSVYFEDRDFVELLFQQFLAKGWVRKLHEMLLRQPLCATAVEYSNLTSLIVRTTFEHPVTFTDARVAQHALSLCHQGGQEFLFKTRRLPPDVKDCTAYVSTLLLVNRKCISIITPRKLLRVKTNVSMSSIPPKSILYAGHGLVVCNKPSGESWRRFANAVLRQKSISGVYLPLCPLPVEAKGLMVLVSCTTATCELLVRMRVQLLLCPQGASCKPLLSTQFFAKYGMTIADISAQQQLYTVGALCEGYGSVMGAMLLQLMTDVNSEGWNCVGNELRSSGSYVIERVDISSPAEESTVFHPTCFLLNQ